MRNVWRLIIHRKRLFYFLFFLLLLLFLFSFLVMLFSEKVLVDVPLQRENCSTRTASLHTYLVDAVANDTCREILETILII